MPRGVIALLNALAVVERLQGNWAAAQTWHERSLAAAREAGDRPPPPPSSATSPTLSARRATKLRHALCSSAG